MADPRELFPSDDYVARTIHFKATALARKLRATTEDRQDFEQRLHVVYLRVRKRHDPARAQMSTFLDRVFTNEVLNMIAEWHTQKRSAERRAIRWNDPLEDDDEDSLTMDETYSSEDYFTRTGFGTRPDSETRDIRLDVQLILQRLPSDLRQVAELLMTGSIAEAARALGIPRSALYDKITRIERGFRKAGLAPIGSTTKPQHPRESPDSSQESSCR